MARNPKVKVRISAEDRASATIGKVESRFTRLGSFLKRNFVAAMAGATIAVFAFVRALKSVISASQTQEDALNALRAATSKFGEASVDVAKRLAEQAAALQKVTRFGDETIIKGQALLATFSDEEEAIRNATVAALDLSTAVGVDLNAAFLLLGKALAGDTATLSRYGIIIEEGIAPQDKFAAVLKKINQQFGGRAQEDVKTFSGRMGQLSNAFSDLLEKIGDTVTKNTGFIDSIRTLTTFIEKNSAAIARFTSQTLAAFSLVIGGIIDKLRQLGTAIGHVVVFFEKLTGSIDKVEISESALAATAKRAGMTAEELRAHLENLDGTVGQVDTSTESAEEKMIKFAKAIKKAADEASASATAMTELGDALGVVTSAELANEIEEITGNLATAREELGSNSREFIRLEQIATEKIQSLQDRIRSLRDGLGDLQTQTEANVTAFDGLGERARTAAVGVDTLTRSVQGHTQASRENIQVISGSSIGASSLIIGDPRSPFAGLPGGTFTTIGPRVRVLPNGRIEFIP